MLAAARTGLRMVSNLLCMDLMCTFLCLRTLKALNKYDNETLLCGYLASNGFNTDVWNMSHVVWRYFHRVQGESDGFMH